MCHVAMDALSSTRAQDRNGGRARQCTVPQLHRDGINVASKTSVVFGGHGDTMVPMPRYVVSAGFR